MNWTAEMKRVPVIAAARGRVARMLAGLHREDAVLAREVCRRIRMARIEVVAVAERDVSLACRTWVVVVK